MSNRLKCKVFPDNLIGELYNVTEEDLLQIKSLPDYEVSIPYIIATVLSKPDAEIVFMFFRDNLSYKEISKRLSLCVSTVQRRFFNALRRLRVSPLSNAIFIGIEKVARFAIEIGYLRGYCEANEEIDKELISAKLEDERKRDQRSEMSSLCADARRSSRVFTGSPIMVFGREYPGEVFATPVSHLIDCNKIFYQHFLDSEFLTIGDALFYARFDAIHNRLASKDSYLCLFGEIEEFRQSSLKNNRITEVVSPDKAICHYPVNLVKALGFCVDLSRNSYKAAVDYVLWDLSFNYKDAVQLLYNFFREKKTISELSVIYGKEEKEITADIDRALALIRESQYAGMISNECLSFNRYDVGYDVGLSKGKEDYISEQRDADATQELLSPEVETATNPLVTALFLEMTLEDLELSGRTYHCLCRAGITTTQKLLRETSESLLKLRDMGVKSVSEVAKKLRDFGIDFH